MLSPSGLRLTSSQLESTVVNFWSRYSNSSSESLLLSFSKFYRSEAVVESISSRSLICIGSPKICFQTTGARFSAIGYLESRPNAMKAPKNLNISICFGLLASGFSMK